MPRSSQAVCTCCKRQVPAVFTPTGADAGSKGSHRLCRECLNRQPISVDCGFTECGACGTQMLKSLLGKHRPHCKGPGGTRPDAPHADLHGTEGVRCSHRQHLVPCEFMVPGMSLCHYCHKKRNNLEIIPSGAAAGAAAPAPVVPEPEERPAKQRRISAGSSTSAPHAHAVPAVNMVPALPMQRVLPALYIPPTSTSPEPSADTDSPPGSSSGSSTMVGADGATSGWSTVTTELTTSSSPQPNLSRRSPTPSSAVAPAVPALMQPRVRTPLAPTPPPAMAPARTPAAPVPSPAAMGMVPAVALPFPPSPLLPLALTPVAAVSPAPAVVGLIPPALAPVRTRRTTPPPQAQPKQLSLPPLSTPKPPAAPLDNMPSLAGMGMGMGGGMASLGFGGAPLGSSSFPGLDAMEVEFGGFGAPGAGAGAGPGSAAADSSALASTCWSDDEDMVGLLSGDTHLLSAADVLGADDADAAFGMGSFGSGPSFGGATSSLAAPAPPAALMDRGSFSNRGPAAPATPFAAGAFAAAQEAGMEQLLPAAGSAKLPPAAMVIAGRQDSLAMFEEFLKQQQQPLTTAAAAAAGTGLLHSAGHDLAQRMGSLTFELPWN